MNEIAKGIIASALGATLTVGLVGSTVGFVDCVKDTNELLDQKESLISSYLKTHDEISDKYVQYCVDNKDYSFMENEQTRTQVEEVSADLDEKHSFAIFSMVGMASCAGAVTECISKAKDCFMVTSSSSQKEEEIQQ